MTGFIKGLFKGGKGETVNQDPASPSLGGVVAGVKKNLFSKNDAPAAPPKAGDDFFLEPDAAKTFGNIDYMREVKTVERTFPKGKRKAQVRQISSNTYRNLDSQYSNGSSSSTAPKQTFATATSFASTTTSTISTSTATASSASASKVETEKRRPAQDTSMDMFRSMAKSIRKG